MVDCFGWSSGAEAEEAAQNSEFTSSHFSNQIGFEKFECPARLITETDQPKLSKGSNWRLSPVDPGEPPMPMSFQQKGQKRRKQLKAAGKQLEASESAMNQRKGKARQGKARARATIGHGTKWEVQKRCGETNQRWLRRQCTKTKSQSKNQNKKERQKLGGSKP